MELSFGALEATLRIRNDESGQVLVITVLCMTVLMGFMGLAVDVGLLFRAQRNLQTAADAAAIAGALDYLYNNSSTKATTAAQQASATNGVTQGSNGTVVAVSTPPTHGPNTGSGGFVEVVVTQPNPTIFMSTFSQLLGGTNFSTVNVSARAVAGAPGTSNACVYVLNPTAAQAMELQGSFDVSTPKCGVVVDSNNADALDFTGAGGTLTAGSISVVGGDGGQVGDASPAPVTGAFPVSDPLNIAGPTTANSGCTTGASGNTSAATSLTGTISTPVGGIICYSNAVTMTNVVLGSGTKPIVVVFENGVTVGGTVGSGSGGSTIDVQGGAFNINTGTVLNITAPSVAPLTSPAAAAIPAGIALMEPLSNSSEIKIQKGDATGTLTGIIYAPAAELFLQDSGGDKSGGITLVTDLIVNTLFDKTATLTINSYSLANPTITPLRIVTLVE